MNPYLLTLSFLTLMTILTSSEVTRFSHTAVGKSLYKEESKRRLANEEAHAIALYEAHHSRDITASSKEKKKEESQPKSYHRKPSSLHLYLSCPPENARLNLPLLLAEAEEQDKLPNGFSYYELAAQLMRRLYKEEPYFQALSRAEYRILDTLFAHKERLSSFTAPEQLATVQFDIPELQNCFYQMLKGTPSLIDFVTCSAGETRSDKQVNLAYADAHLISAIFSAYPHLARELIAFRDQWMEQVIAQEEVRLTHHWKEGEWQNRTALSNSLKAGFEQIVGHSHLDVSAYKRLFDFTLGKKGNTLYIIDPVTQLPTRSPHRA